MNYELYWKDEAATDIVLSGDVVIVEPYFGTAEFEELTAIARQFAVERGLGLEYVETDGANYLYSSGQIVRWLDGSLIEIRRMNLDIAGPVVCGDVGFVWKNYTRLEDRDKPIKAVTSEDTDKEVAFMPLGEVGELLERLGLTVRPVPEA